MTPLLHQAQTIIRLDMTVGGESRGKLKVVALW